MDEKTLYQEISFFSDLEGKHGFGNYKVMTSAFFSHVYAVSLPAS